MFKFMEEFKKDMESSAIKSTFRRIFDCEITYDIDEEDNILEVEIRDKRNFDGKKYDLPTLKEIKQAIKKQYKKSDVEKIKKISYRFTLCNECNNLEIDAKNSDIFMAFSKCDSLKIKGADNVFLRFVTVDDILEIEAKSVKFHNDNTHINNNFNVKADVIDFWDSRIHTENEINLTSRKLKFNQNSLFAKNSLSLTSDEIDVENSEFSSKGKLIINDKKGDAIKKVSASKIIYNGIDISNDEKILMPELRQRLISDLRKIKKDVCKRIENEVRIESEKLKKDLNNSSVSKVLKK